jgi:hypothetical protein
MPGPLGGDAREPGALTTYIEDVDGGPLEGDARDPGAPTTHVEDVDGGPLGGPVSIPSRKVCMTCICIIDRSNSAHRSHSPYA